MCASRRRGSFSAHFSYRTSFQCLLVIGPRVATLVLLWNPWRGKRSKHTTTPFSPCNCNHNNQQGNALHCTALHNTKTYHHKTLSCIHIPLDPLPPLPAALFLYCTVLYCTVLSCPDRPTDTTPQIQISSRPGQWRPLRNPQN